MEVGQPETSHVHRFENHLVADRDVLRSRVTRHPREDPDPLLEVDHRDGIGHLSLEGLHLADNYPRYRDAVDPPPSR